MRRVKVFRPEGFKKGDEDSNQVTWFANMDVIKKGKFRGCADFHQFVSHGMLVCAIVEFDDGNVEVVPAKLIRFDDKDQSKAKINDFINKKLDGCQCRQ